MWEYIEKIRGAKGVILKEKTENNLKKKKTSCNILKSYNLAVIEDIIVDNIPKNTLYY